MKKFVLGFAFAILFYNVIQSKPVLSYLEKKIAQFDTWVESLNSSSQH